MKQWVGPIVRTVAIGVAYFLAARLSLLLMTEPGVAVFWPAAGVASGTLIALGRTARWPVAVGVIAATIAANLTGDRNVLSSSIFALSDAGEALLVAWMIERYIGSDFSLGRLRHVLALLVAAILGSAVSGVGGTLGYKLGYNPHDPAWTVWRQWVASDAIGIIAVAPLIISFVAGLRAPPSRRELIEGGVALIAAAATTGIIIFMLPPDWWEMCVSVVLLFPVVLWIAARCQPAFASAAVFIVSLIVMVTVIFGLGNFGNTAPSMGDSALSAQITILGTAFSAFVLSALFAERRHHEAALADSETRLQEALAVGAVIAFQWDTSTDSVRCSNNAEQILGYNPQQTFDRGSFIARVHPDDLGHKKELWSNLYPNNSRASASYRFLRPDGREIWLQEISKGEFDSTGQLVRVKGLALDVTEHKLAEDRQKTLTSELQHRTNNLLTVVQTLATRTLSSGYSLKEANDILEARLQALARANKQLLESDWSGLTLGEIVKTELEPYLPRCEIEGADIVLGRQCAQNFSLILHELTTNAIKYGALSNPEGRVHVSWGINGDGRDSQLIFHWREQGGPPVVAPKRRGFGSTLLRVADARSNFDTNGFNCNIEVPFREAAPRLMPELETGRC